MTEVGRTCNYSKYVADRSEERATISLIKNLMESTHITADKAMEMLKISPADRAKYKAQLVQ